MALATGAKLSPSSPSAVKEAKKEDEFGGFKPGFVVCALKFRGVVSVRLVYGSKPIDFGLDSCSALAGLRFTQSPKTTACCSEVRYVNCLLFFKGKNPTLYKKVSDL